MAAEPLVPQNYVIPNTGGITVAVNNVGTSGAQVIGTAGKSISGPAHAPMRSELASGKKHYRKQRTYVAGLQRQIHFRCTPDSCRALPHRWRQDWASRNLGRLLHGLAGAGGARRQSSQQS